MPATSERGEEAKADEPQQRGPRSFAKEVGVIVPPPELKAIVDKCVEFVRKNGIQFEDQIRQRNAENPSKRKQFAFLWEESPYHAYYRAQLAQTEEERAATQALEDARAQAQTQAEKSRRKAEAEEEAKRRAEAAKPKEPTLSEKLKALHLRLKKPVIPQPPPQDVYHVRTPAAFAAVDIDIIKLTAQFVARNGRKFLEGLSAREQRNPQFDFLKPTHPLFTYFQQLVAAYAQIIIPPVEHLDGVRKDLEDDERLLNRILARRRHEQMQLDKEKRNSMEDEEERTAMALIDWQDFVVVESIQFDDADDPYLPRPGATIEEMNAILLQQSVQQQNLAGTGREGALASGAGTAEKAKTEDEDMDMDVEMEMSEEEEEGGEAYAAKPPLPIKREQVVQRRADVARHKEEAERAMRYQVCPVCQQEIPIHELEEHMRIELLDPRWKEQKRMLQERQRESTLATGLDIGANLSRLARKRADVFIDTEDEEVKRRHEEEEKAQASRPQWDGFSSSRDAARTAMAMHAQQQAVAVASGIPPPAAAPPPPPEQQLLPPSQPAPPAFQPPHIPLQQQPPLPPGPPPAMPGLPGIPGMPPIGFGPYRQPPLPAGPPGPFDMMGMPPLPLGLPPSGIMGMVHMPPSYEEEELPAPKKARAGPELEPEDEFASKFHGPITVHVAVPSEPSYEEWTLNGQTLQLQFNVIDTVNTLKQAIEKEVSVPSGKQKLRVTSNGQFLNNNARTLAFYNVGDGASLELSVKERGGRKK